MGGAAACRALEIDMTIGDSDYGSIGVGSWWVDDSISNRSEVVDGSYGCSISINELSQLVVAAIWHWDGSSHACCAAKATC